MKIIVGILVKVRLIKEQNPAKRAGRGAWMVVQAEITPVEPDSDNADVGNIGASRMTLISVHLLILNNFNFYFVSNNICTIFYGIRLTNIHTNRRIEF